MDGNDVFIPGLSSLFARLEVDRQLGFDCLTECTSSRYELELRNLAKPQGSARSHKKINAVRGNAHVNTSHRDCK